MALNESPSEKEGKFALSADLSPIGLAPSMKVPPKRKGNLPFTQTLHALDSTLNESPSEKEGKSMHTLIVGVTGSALNESPSEKEGKCKMQPNPKCWTYPLNESPSEKEGKSIANPFEGQQL